MDQHTAKHFVLQLGSLASLYVSLLFFLVLVFGFVDLRFPDATEDFWNISSAESMVRLGFAMTIVFFPTYLVLTRLVNQNRRASHDGMYLGLTKWLIYLSLLIGGTVLLVDLVVVIMGWLEGELTHRFLVKAAAVLVATGAAFLYYLKDAQGYWLTHEKQSFAYAMGISSLVVAVLISALAYIDTPGEARAKRLDQQQVTDLRDWQWAIESYLYTNERLPAGIGVVYAGHTTPSAPAGRAAYRYELTETGFNLCAEFSAASPSDDRYYPYYERSHDGPHLVNPDDWYYEAGNYCFKREVRF